MCPLSLAPPLDLPARAGQGAAPPVSGLRLARGRIVAASAQGDALPGGCGRVQVRLEGEDHFCTRAASCLVEPGPGDTVLLLLSEDAPACILAVLERGPGAAALRLKPEGALEVEASSLRLRSGGELALEAGGRLHLLARRVEAQALRLEARIQRSRLDLGSLELQGRRVRLRLRRLESVVLQAEQFFQRLSVRAGRSFRSVEGHEDLQAGSCRIQTEGLLALQAREAQVLAQEDLGLNAAQVRLG